MKIEHIGIAVKDIAASNEIFSALLGVKPYKEERVESENVITSFFQVGDSKIELVQATSPDSAIAKFLEKNKEGMHHIAFEVQDIYAEIERLKSEGFTLIHEAPKEGADNKLIAFLHPKSTQKLLVEICQEIR